MKLRDLETIRKQFGTRWLTRRALYSLKVRSGALRRKLPVRNWSDKSLQLAAYVQDGFASPEVFFEHRVQDAPRFFFSAQARDAYRPILEQWDIKQDNPQSIADRAALGTFRFFEHDDIELGFPPDWHANAQTGERASPTLHWSSVGDFEHGDIKLIWEPSRFTFVYALVRAYWRTGDEKYPETFWKLVESWREQNPPQHGANWKCGQEATFRLMAWSFGLHGFLKSSKSTPQRVAQLGQMFAVTAARIEGNIDYALSQQNNHGISEAVGLFTVGILFPEFRDAERWRKRGRALLEIEARKLIYPDGAFSQHSANYHRLMLHDYLWAMRLGELNDQPFSPELRERIDQAAQFLFQIQDDTTGCVPNYGHNDGALILPLNNCEFDDFRPVISAVRFETRATRTFGDGAWDEDLLWLFGPGALDNKVEKPSRTDLNAQAGGCYTLRSENGFIFARCGQFQHRPAHADMLHVDLWWRGHNIAIDAGTFSYNAPIPWDNAFAGTAFHNTVTVDGFDQMERAGKFLWLPWVQGKVRHLRRFNGSLAYFEGEHDGFSRLADPVIHRRAIVQMGNESWAVVDSLRGEATHDFRLHWLLADLPHEWDEKLGRLTLHTDAGLYFVQSCSLEGERDYSLIRGDETSPQGWRSRRYGSREPAISVTLRQARPWARFLTLFSPESAELDTYSTGFRVRSQSVDFKFELGCETDPLIARILTREDSFSIES